MDIKKCKIIKVMIEHQYLIEVYKDGTTEINGWTVEQVMENWFKTHNINSYHATRNACEIGGGNKFISYKVVDV